jgi:hypothetical protein
VTIPRRDVDVAALGVVQLVQVEVVVAAKNLGIRWGNASNRLDFTRGADENRQIVSYSTPLTYMFKAKRNVVPR